MAELFCVRTEFGKYTEDFMKGGYIAIGWLPINDLSNIGTTYQKILKTSWDKNWAS